MGSGKNMKNFRADMKGDWNRRARENPRKYIATSQWESEEVFDRSGALEAALFFEGEEGKLLSPETVLVDIGCGIGRMDRHLAPRVGRLYGIDVSGEMVAQARKRLDALKNVEFLEGNGWNLDPLPGNFADIVICHLTFQHVPRQVTLGYFKHVLDVLKPGGSFLFQMLETIGEPPPDPPDEITFEPPRYFREKELRSRLEEIGYDWVSCRRYRIEEPDLSFDHVRPWVRKPGQSGFV